MAEQCFDNSLSTPTDANDANLSEPDSDTGVWADGDPNCAGNGAVGVWVPPCGTYYANDREELADIYPNVPWANSDFDNLFDEDDNKKYPTDGTYTYQMYFDDLSAGYFSRECILHHETTSDHEIYMSALRVWSVDMYKLIDYCFDWLAHSLRAYVCGSSGVRRYFGQEYFDPRGGTYIVTKSMNYQSGGGVGENWISWRSWSGNPQSGSGVEPNCPFNNVQWSRTDFNLIWPSTFADAIAGAPNATAWWDIDTGDFYSTYGWTPGTCIDKPTS